MKKVTRVISVRRSHDAVLVSTKDPVTGVDSQHYLYSEMAIELATALLVVAKDVRDNVNPGEVGTLVLKDER